MKRILVLFTLLPLLSGCWSRTEVNDLGIVLGVALDKAEHNKIRLALQIAVPKASGGASGSSQGSSGSESTIMVSAEGESVMEAYRKIQEKISRRIFFAHDRVIIVGEELAREGTSTFIDFFIRHRQSHLRNYILVTHGEAIDVLKKSPQFESVTAEEIREKEKTDIGINVRVREFWERMMTEGEETIAARVSILPLVESTQKETGVSNKTPSINGTAVFKGDRLIGWLNEKETRGILWIRNELKTGVLAISLPKEKGGGRIGAQIWNISTKIKPIIHNGKLKIKIVTNGQVEIYSNSTKWDLGDPRALDSLEPILEKDVKNRIQLTLDKVQHELKSDIFGFGQAVYRENPKNWENYYKKNWYSIFPNLEVEISPHITITGTGFTT